MNDRFKDLKGFMDITIPKLGLSGIDCIIYQNHQEIFRYAAGYKDVEEKSSIIPGTLYNIYSATKVVTCVAALQLFEKGMFRLLDPVSMYLPEFSNMKVKYGEFSITPAQNQIKIADLFQMTAGLNYELNTPEKKKLMDKTSGNFNTRDFVKAIAEEPLLFEPGNGWRYSYCHDVLAVLIEVLSGKTFGEYLNECIFIPLGMIDSGFTLPEEKHHRLAPQYQYNAETCSVTRISDKCLGAAGTFHESGGGGLITTAEDYILFADALACGGIGKSGARILSKRTIDLMSKNQLIGKCLEDYRRMVPNKGIGYGLGVATIMDSANSYMLAPENAFYWGGMGGVQDLFDTQNKIAYFVAQHAVGSPTQLLLPSMLNILYSII